MFLIAFPVTSCFTLTVRALCSGLHIFCGTWLRGETCQGRAIGFVSRLALHRKKRTLHCIQLRFLG